MNSELMGLAKVLLGRGSKEAGLSKCVRVDSLGLAKRRLAAKAVQEEPASDAPDVEEPLSAGNDGDGAAASHGPTEQEPRDDSDVVLRNLMNRQHRDSLRIHRRRFRARASLDLSSAAFADAFPDKGASWSSGTSPTAPAGRVEEEHGNEDGEAAGCSAPARHVRFRRASDGEYLVRQTPKSPEASLPNALRAVQLKAERLFRRLTANFAEQQPRPRSDTPSRGGSPPRSQRTSASRAASASRSSASWVLGPRHRSIDASAGVDIEITPAARAMMAADGVERASAGGSGRRAKRQSAPGELFFSVAGPEPGSPAHCSGWPPHTNSMGRDSAAGGTQPGPAAGSSKGRNWLARLSRGLTVSTAYKPSQATPPTSPPPASRGDFGRSSQHDRSVGAGGGTAAGTGPIPAVAAADAHTE